MKLVEVYRRMHGRSVALATLCRALREDGSASVVPANHDGPAISGTQPTPSDPAVRKRGRSFKAFLRRKRAKRRAVDLHPRLPVRGADSRGHTAAALTLQNKRQGLNG